MSKFWWFQALGGWRCSGKGRHSPNISHLGTHPARETASNLWRTTVLSKLCLPKPPPNCSFPNLLTLGSGNELGAAPAMLGWNGICTCTKKKSKICLYSRIWVSPSLWGTGMQGNGSGALQSSIFCFFFLLERGLFRYCVKVFTLLKDSRRSTAK